MKTIRLEFHPGCTINDAASMIREMLSFAAKMATEYGTVTTLAFNEMEVTADPGESAATVVKKWRAARSFRPTDSTAFRRQQPKERTAASLVVSEQQLNQMFLGWPLEDKVMCVQMWLDRLEQFLEPAKGRPWNGTQSRSRQD
jgi:hypothetical protein